MKLEFWLPSSTTTFAHTKRLLLMSQAVVYGKLPLTTIIHISFLNAFTFSFSLVMEYADNGDVF